MKRTKRPDFAELTQPGLMRTLDMVLDPEKTLETPVARTSKPTFTSSAAIARNDNAHRTIQMLIALVAAMVLLMFMTS